MTIAFLVWYLRPITTTYHHSGDDEWHLTTFFIVTVTYALTAWEMFVMMLPKATIQTTFYKPLFYKGNLAITWQSSLDGLPCLHYNNSKIQGIMRFLLPALFWTVTILFLVWISAYFFPHSLSFRVQGEHTRLILLHDTIYFCFDYWEWEC